jgi:predicted amidohydrolase YtcJ
MLMPGLHDVHMHLFGIVDPDICTLESGPLSLPELAERVKTCIAHYALSPGEWLTVDAWSFSFGNQPGDWDGEQLSSLRAALDAACWNTRYCSGVTADITAPQTARHSRERLLVTDGA